VGGFATTWTCILQPLLEYIVKADRIFSCFTVFGHRCRCSREFLNAGRKLIHKPFELTIDLSDLLKTVIPSKYSQNLLPFLPSRVLVWFILFSR